MIRALTCFTATVLMAGTPGAFAASATDLSVTGVITPSSCVPSLSSGGIVDHGKLTVKDWPPTSRLAWRPPTCNWR